MNLRLRQFRITGRLFNAFSDMIITDIIIRRDVNKIMRCISKDHYFIDVDGMGRIFEYNISRIPKDYIETMESWADKERFSRYYDRWKRMYEEEKFAILFTEDFMPIRNEITGLINLLLNNENILLLYDCSDKNRYLDKMIKAMVDDEFTMVDHDICGGKHIMEIAKKG